MKCWTLGFAVVVLPVTLSSASADIVTTIPAWESGGHDRMGTFGESEQSIATLGQTFTTNGSTQVLESFTFYADDRLDPGYDFLDFGFYVAEWGDNRAIGSLLYESSMQTTTDNGGAGGFEEFTFATGGVQLTEGRQYVLFLSASKFFDGVDGTIKIGVTDDTTPYPGGTLVLARNGSDFSSLFTDPWVTEAPTVDMAFTATFSNPIPEPSTLALLSMGILAFLAYAWRRRRS